MISGQEGNHTCAVQFTLGCVAKYKKYNGLSSVIGRPGNSRGGTDKLT